MNIAVKGQDGAILMDLSFRLTGEVIYNFGNVFILKLPHETKYKNIKRK